MFAICGDAPALKDLLPHSQYLRRADIHNPIIWTGLLLLSLGAVITIVPLYIKVHFNVTYPASFALNWTAALGWRSGLSLYDWPALHLLEQRVVGSPTYIGLFSSLLNTYNNSPTTAFLYLPFTVWSFPLAFHLYQGWMIVLFIAAAGVAVQTLPRQERGRSLLLGLLLLVLLEPFQETMSEGQVDGWIVLALAVGLWATQRAHWTLAGAAIGFAALLKISPGLLLIYLLWHRKWRAVLAAGLVFVGILSLTAIMGRLGDWAVWIGQVLPQIADGTLAIYNQSLPATVARLVGTETDYTNLGLPLGGFRYLALPFAGLFLILAKRTGRPATDPAVLAVLILGALLMGPLSWISYATWTLPALIQLTAQRLWAGRLPETRFRLKMALVAGGLLQIAPPRIGLDPAALASHWELRLLTTLPVLGILLWFTVGAVLILHSPLPAASHLADTHDPQYAKGLPSSPSS